MAIASDVHRQEQCRRIEQALLAHPGVVDCAVVERGAGELVAYVVPASAFAAGDLAGWLNAKSQPCPSVFVPVTSVPLTADGGVDVALLSRLPVSDTGLMERWETAAKAVAGVEAAAAILDGRSTHTLPLHLSTLLPDWTPRPPVTSACDVSHQSASRVSSAPRRAAIVDGGRLRIGPAAPVCLSDALDRAATASRNGLVYVESDGSTNAQPYAALLENAERILAGLQMRGLKPGDRVVFQLERHQDFVETFWACVLGGFVPVPLAVAASYERASATLDALQSAWQILETPHIVAARAAIDQLGAATARAKLDDVRVHAVEDLRGNWSGRRHQSAPDDLALLMLTSGSTGAPKAVMLTHRNVLSRSGGSAQLNGFSQRDVSLNWMPLDHVAGLIYFHIRDVYLGCPQVHVPTGSILQDPLLWIDYLHRFKATITFAPNFAFALVNDRARDMAGRSWDLSNLQFVLNGAEAIVARTARRFLTLLRPHGLGPTSMHPAWGMSETSSGVIYGDRFSLATSADDQPFVEVGRPIPGLSIRIVRSDDSIADEGEVGRLQVRGPVVTRGYFGNPDATRESFTADGWFNTGDLGTIGDGRLTITGREKDVVIINSVNYYCHAIESVVEAIDGVATSFTAACAVRPSGADTDRLAIFFHPSDHRPIAEFLARIRAEVTAKIGIAPDYIVPVDAESIPKSSLGKVQRSELGRRFLAGEFDEILRHVDRLASNANTIPDWFFRKVWRRKEGTSDPSTLDQRSTALIFSAGDDLADQTRRRLAARGVNCVTVEHGDRFAALGDGRYQIDRRSERDYQALMTAVAQTGRAPSHIVQLWGYGAYAGETIGGEIEDAQFDGALSAVWLSHALARLPARDATISMLFVASHAQSVNQGEAVAYEKSPAVGVLKSLPQEIPCLRCRHVDLYSTDAAAAASAIVDELCILQEDREVAYRDGHRFVSGLEKIVFDGRRPLSACRTSGSRKDGLFARGGTYLITGGVGGIGERIAAFLLERFDANLLLVGRGAPDSEREAVVGRLRSRGGSVAYQAVDVCDEESLTSVIDAYKKGWDKRFDGAIHLAGIYYESLAADETSDRFLSMLRPKTVGTDVLDRVMAREGETFIISSSSIAGFFGGGSIAAYSAANCFQEAYAAHRRSAGLVKHYCFSWSNWNEVGQSRAYQLKDSPRARGYLPIEPVQALQSLMIGLSFGESSLLVGLDGGHRHVRRSMVEAPDVLEKLVVYYTIGEHARTEPSLDTLDVRDRFGATARPDVVRIQAMPMTCSGEVDKDQLARLARGRENSGSAPPKTATERRLAETWARILGRPTASRDDNFFDLGGDSLLAARLVAAIRETFGSDVTLRMVFDAETLADLAGRIDETGAARTAEAGPPIERPLSHGQRALWFLHQMAPESAAYNIAFTARVVSALDLDALRSAFQVLVDRHEALRTVFPSVRGEPMQRVHGAAHVSFEVEDASGSSEADMHERVSREITRPFALASGPLMRVRVYTGADAGVFLAVTFHHIVMDGWSLWVCLSEVREAYRAAARGEAANLPPVDGESEIVARSQAEADAARDLEFWKEHVGGSAPLVNLPTDRPRPPVPAHRGAAERFRIGRDATTRLKALAREGRGTAQMGLLALFQILLQRYTGQDDLMVGYLASGRSRPELASSVGYLANLLPLRLTLPPGSTFRGVLKRTRDTLLSAFEHQDYPFLELVERVAGDRDPSRSPLFQVLFVYEKPQLLEEQNAAAFIAGTAGARMRLGDLELESLPFSMQQEGQFDLTLMLVEVDGEFCVTLDYDAALFDAATIRRMGGHLQELAASASTQPDESISELEMLTGDERRQLRAWNSVEVSHGEGCVHELFERVAAEHPDLIAVVAGGARATYREINERANRLAHCLRELGVNADTPVGLLVERSSIDLPVGMLAILKAGGAFVPLDQSQPSERLTFMLVDSGAPVLVTQSALADRISGCAGRVVALDRDASRIERFSGANPISASTSGSLAYIIYTSGSTGVPKGVLLEHRGLWNVAREQQRLFGPGPGSRVLQFAAASFDAAVFDVVMALCSGATLHLASRDSILPGLPLLATLKEEAINILTIPPSALANLPLDPLPALKVLLVAGEACPPELVERWARNRRFLNLYGPTEATIWATYAECHDGDGHPPIGTPIANTEALVLDPNRRELPIGVPGELYLGGAGLARGYLNRPELNSSSFVSNRSRDGSIARLYKTGDLVRRAADGQLHYLGRADAQVKLRGFRIELGEIEATLCRHPDVDQAVVILREDTPGDRRLVAYVVPHGLHTVRAAGLRTFLRRELPDYMVPAAFVTMSEFPLNASGKADRRAFPAPTGTHEATERFAKPSGVLEELIVGVWKDVLGIDAVGAEDNFFDIGGNSLLMAQVHARLSETAPSPVSIVDMFRFPTIRTLAAHLAEAPIPIDVNPLSAGRTQALTVGHARLRHQAQRRSSSNASGQSDGRR